jgi:hypothetical protein
MGKLPDSSLPSNRLGASGRRFVVLAEPDRPLPGALLTALSQRSGQVVTVKHGPEAMVELAKGAADVLIIVRPDSQMRIDELVAAVRRYHGRTACWAFSNDAAGKPRLVRINGLADPAQPPADDPSVAAKKVDRLRSLLVKVPGEPQMTGPRITEEELAMLLGPTPGELEAEDTLRDNHDE